MFLFPLNSFRIMLATQWIDQLDKEAALGELDDGDIHAIHAVNRHFRNRLMSQLHRIEE